METALTCFLGTLLLFALLAGFVFLRFRLEEAAKAEHTRLTGHTNFEPRVVIFPSTELEEYALYCTECDTPIVADMLIKDL